MSTSSADTTHRAEIHSHSTASDGATAPSRLAELCHEQGVEIWSLTDHDNCFGCAEADRCAEQLGMTFIPGIEISAFHGTSVHVLGYGVAYDGPEMVGYSARRVDGRKQRMVAMIDRLANLGVDVDMEHVERVADGGILGRPHLARTLKEQGSVDTIQEAFDRFLHTGGPAHVAMQWPSVPEAIDIIHRAGGVAVLAHPGQYDLDDAVARWVEAGLDGIEVIHPNHSDEHIVRYEGMANDLQVLKTASSDFHGTRKRDRYFGSVPFPVAWLEAFLEAVGVDA